MNFNGGIMINRLKKEENRVNWEHLVEQTAQSFRLTNQERDSLKNTKIAQLIGALPFLANCNQPERTSLAHLSIYLIAMKGSKSEFYHDTRDNNNVLNRLEAINHFDGGDKKIIEKGMKLLALNMVHDYMRDIEEDSLNNKYNPISAGEWDYKTIVRELTADITAIDCPQMDDYFTAVDTPFMYWR